MTIQLGLAANQLHHRDPDAILFRWLALCAPAIRELGIRLHTVGRTFDAIEAGSALAGYEGMVRYPYGRAGGLMRLVSAVAGGTEYSCALDGAIYLIDPVDPSSHFPEALALKRQCVTHRKPFVSTLAGAVDWVEVMRMEAGLAPVAAWDARFDLERETLALIAHDALKDEMLAYAREHFDLLSRFARRVATGTTGSRLNELAWSLGWPRERRWCDPYLSGPMGGDAQIAELVLDGRCHRVFFFEDPHVARQHEADIQLLERAVRVATDTVSCITSPAVTRRWSDAVARRTAARARMPRTS